MFCRNFDFFALALVLLGMAVVDHLPRRESTVSLNTINTIRYHLVSR